MVELTRAAEWLANAERVLVSTGAGMSRESGIPTFRDALEGLWARYDPQELATELGFRRNPRRVWSWYAARRRTIAQAVPHAGYHALVEMESALPSLTVVTQNIDGLHALAGSRDVVELHGSIRRAKCLDRHHPFTGPVPDDGAEESDPPPCPVCGSPLRPDVVWFGEMLPEAAVERAWRLAAECDVLLVVGTSGTVWPAAELPHVAMRSGARVVEVNPERSELTPIASVFLEGPAGEVLPRLAAAVTERKRSGG
jgi:NAD-dependent protein deacetylase/lipoamidase